VKKLSLAMLLFSAPVFAGSGSINLGSSLTTGPGLNHHSLFGAKSNPAMAPLAIREDEYWRFNFAPAISSNYEVGQVDNLEEDIDELIDLFEDPNATNELPLDVLDRFNGIIETFGEYGYIQNNTSIAAPVLPLFVSSDALGGGTLSVDFSLNVQIGLRILDSPLTFNFDRLIFESNTAAYLKSGIEKKLSVGYGKQIFEGEFDKHGKLYAGAKVSIISMELSKQIARFQDLIGNNIDDYINDVYDKNLVSSTSVGLDLGIVWDTEHYRAGFSLLNFNSPEFNYGIVGENCDAIPDDATFELNSCVVSRFYVEEGRIDASETHTSYAVGRAEGLLKLTDSWVVSSSVDLAKYNDFIGFENQWLNIATSVEGNYYIPGFRAGIQKNLVGSELSSFMVGITLFKFLNLDAEMSSDKIQVDGKSAPRRLGFSISITENF